MNWDIKFKISSKGPMSTAEVFCDKFCFFACNFGLTFGGVNFSVGTNCVKPNEDYSSKLKGLCWVSIQILLQNLCKCEKFFICEERNFRKQIFQITDVVQFLTILRRLKKSILNPRFIHDNHQWNWFFVPSLFLRTFVLKCANPWIIVCWFTVNYMVLSLSNVNWTIEQKNKVIRFWIWRASVLQWIFQTLPWSSR